MLNQSFLFSLYILILGFIFSGNASINTSNIVHELNNKRFDTVVRDIPLGKNGKPASYYRDKPIVENMMGLSSLESGFDSLQIRLWYSYGRSDSAQLIIFKSINGAWSGELYSLIYLTNENGSRHTSIPFTKRAVKPISGWKYFTNKLLRLHIYTLPDEGKILNYPDWTEPSAIIIEIATLKNYRIYMYNQPASAQKRIWQAKNIERILELVENEFRIKRLHKF